jgi:CBS domain-containing protein
LIISEGKLVGVFSERDYARKIILQGREIMTGDPVTVTADHTLISIGDLVNSIIASQAQTIDHLHTYITGGYPA